MARLAVDGLFDRKILDGGPMHPQIGDPAGVPVYQFRMLGSHENFYRDLGAPNIKYLRNPRLRGDIQFDQASPGR